MAELHAFVLAGTSNKFTKLFAFVIADFFIGPVAVLLAFKIASISNDRVAELSAFVIAGIFIWWQRTWMHI